MKRVLKRALLSFTLTLCTLAFTAETVAAQGIIFHQITLNEAVAKAKAENKLVFIDVYTDWCAPCKLMSQQIFPMKELGDYFNPKFISVQYEGEKSEEGKALVAKYKISAYPTFIILDANGTMLHLFAGGVLSVAFIDKVAEAFNPDKAMGTLQKKYDSGDRSKKTMSNYIQALMESHTANYEPLLKKFEDSLSTQDLISPECLFIYDDLARLGSKREQFFSSNIEKFRTAVGREKADTVMKKKYEAYYAQILSYKQFKNTQQLDSINARLSALNLSKADVLLAYQTAIKVGQGKADASEVMKAVKVAAPKVHSNEIDVFIYYAVPALFNNLKPEQVDELVATLKNQNVIPKVQSQVKRLRDAASKPAAK